jgi:hypothetical protein
MQILQASNKAIKKSRVVVVVNKPKRWFQVPFETWCSRSSQRSNWRVRSGAQTLSRTADNDSETEINQTIRFYGIPPRLSRQLLCSSKEYKLCAQPCLCSRKHTAVGSYHVCPLLQAHILAILSFAEPSNKARTFVTSQYHRHNKPLGFVHVRNLYI